MDVHTIVQVYIPLTIATIMFTMGLGLRVADFKRIVVQRRAVTVGILGQLVLLPVIGFLIAAAFALPAPLAIGLVLLTACPGGASSNLYSNLARGDTALSVTLTAVTGIVTIFTIPLVTNLAVSQFGGEGTEAAVTMPILETMLKIVLMVGVPLAVGMFIRAKAPTRAARLESVIKKAAIVMLVILIIGAIAKEGKLVGQHFLDLGIPVVLLSGGTMLVGYLLARVSGLGTRQAITITIEIGMQNGALAIALATEVLGSDEIAMPAAIYSIIAYFTCGVVLFIGRRVLPPEAADPPETVVETRYRVDPVP